MEQRSGKADPGAKPPPPPLLPPQQAEEVQAAIAAAEAGAGGGQAGSVYGHLPTAWHISHGGTSTATGSEGEAQEQGKCRGGAGRTDVGCATTCAV